jgi:hypothetical protein
MALIHMRTRRVFYSRPTRDGALGTLDKIHTLEGLNHRFEAGLKNNPVGFLCFFFVFFWFFLFFYIFTQKREFLGFFQFQEYFYVHPDFKL